jgi:hypothetical protein
MCIVYTRIYMLSKQQLTTDKIYYSTEKTEEEAHRLIPYGLYMKTKI